MIKTNYLNFKWLVVCVFSLLLLTNCESTADFSYFENEIEDPTISASLKPVRLGYVSYSAKDLFASVSTSNLKIKTSTDSNEPITFVYSERLDFNANAGDFVSIDDFSETSTEKLNPFEDVIPTETYTYTDSGNSTDNTIKAILEVDGIPLEESFGLDELISFASFRSGDFSVSFTSTYDFDIVVAVEIPSLIKIGDNASKAYFKQTLNFNESKKSDVLNIDLSEYFIDFTYTKDPTDDSKFVSNNCIENPASAVCTYNNIIVDIKTSFSLEVGDVIRKSDDLTYTMEGSNVRPLIVKGDFSSRALEIGEQTINFDFFDEFEGLTYKAPKLTFDVTNGHGLPVGLDLTKISSINTTTNAKVDLNITDPLAFPGNLFKIGGATLTSTNQSVPFKTTNTLSDSNSNLSDLIGSHQPNQFKFDVAGNINPDGLPSGGNFVDLENGIDFNIGVEIPLEVKMENLDFSPEAVDFELDIEEYAESAEIVLRTYNGLPFEGTLNLVFLDKDKNEVIVNGSAFKKSVTVPSPSTTNGVVDVKITEENDVVTVTKNGVDITEDYTKNDETNKNMFTITFTADEVDVLKNIKYAKIELFLNTPADPTNADFVKVLNENKIRIELAGGGKFNASDL